MPASSHRLAPRSTPRLVQDTGRRLGLTGYGIPPPPAHTAHPQPGDRLLFFTDGLTDARSATGELFGEEHLPDIAVRVLADGLPSPEALRRLIQQILVHQDQRLGDDATVLLAEWHPGRR
ncbi:SpoIIE family protein phosphatase [Streptomyces sp. NPDC014773]|uniref:SpoIIE family protein phosphatase n=1 Tax=Streptomyces sp. NPDC014773 TaxID=3364908 RepID=UPI0036FEA660